MPGDLKCIVGWIRARRDGPPHDELPRLLDHIEPVLALDIEAGLGDVQHEHVMDAPGRALPSPDGGHGAVQQVGAQGLESFHRRERLGHHVVVPGFISREQWVHLQWRQLVRCS